jgi:hypothetical protein
MNVSAIDPTTHALIQAAAAVNALAKPAAPSPAAPATPAPARAVAQPQTPAAAQPAPAVKVNITGVPATVKPEDRALYMQILKSVGGNVNAALAGLAAAEAKEAQS